MRHRLEPLADTLHGDWDPGRPPVLTVDSGDEIDFATLDVAWGLENHRSDGGPRRKFEPRSEGPCLTGPVAVRGAEPGQLLDIDILQVVTGAWGWTYAGGPGMFNADLNRHLGVRDASATLIWELKDGFARNQFGHRLATAPFPGVLGMPAGGRASGWFPSRSGGNLDCRHLQAGSRLYLPIALPGGLLSAGGGHALQGDGECGSSAIECPLESLRVRVEVCEDESIQQPVIQLSGGAWVVLGLGSSLDEATVDAMQGLLRLLTPRLRLERAQILALASVVCDLQVTQLVNGVVGVHAFWKGLNQNVH